MNRPGRQALIECTVGLIAILVGLALQGIWTDRAELWAALLAGAGSGVVALAAHVGKSRHRLLTSLALIVALVNLAATLKVVPRELTIPVRDLAALVSLVSALLVLFEYIRPSPVASSAPASQRTKHKYGWRPVLITACVFAALGWSSVVVPSPIWLPASLFSILLCVISMVWSLSHSLSRERTPLRFYVPTWLLGAATVLADVALLCLIGSQLE